ncbi:MAG TPA: GNAT family N-acetyltransferase [Candidatus Hydrogenedentes bacterium]|nr:GNAT family N-acetyltransferase [Candidatus Hydrogenedentota bacterium]
MPNASNIVVRGVENADELRRANDLMAKTHCMDYFRGLEWLEKVGRQYPNFLIEHTRIALHDGDLAGALRLNTETIRIGEARLKMGGFGWVTTDGRHRRKGVALALIRDTMHYMKRHGYHVSMLFGIPNFYHRFGFVTTLADYAIVVGTGEAATTLRGAWKLRDAKPSDIRAIQKLHNANDAHVACSLLRSAAHITNKWDNWRTHLHVMTTAQGKVVAYCHAHPGDGELLVDDLGLEPAAQARPTPSVYGSAEAGLAVALLKACSDLAAQEHAGRLRFQLPPPHPFARFLLQYTSTHEMRLVRDRGGMMAFVDLDEALESMIPEWESRLTASVARDERIELTLVVDRAPYRVRANRGAVDVALASGTNKVSLTAGELMHLVTGYRYAPDVLAARRRSMTAQSRTFFNILFPKRHPYVWHFDRF